MTPDAPSPADSQSPELEAIHARQQERVRSRMGWIMATGGRAGSGDPNEQVEKDVGRLITMVARLTERLKETAEYADDTAKENAHLREMLLESKRIVKLGIGDGWFSVKWTKPDIAAEVARRAEEKGGG
jgi:hypothetical protein